ncbi:hypothetical protein B0T17DRAFT_611535 [Bombardia bombarda]|uniref:Rhodopsin domain-containing protein n=1 Tax=Bombardia bombarda TaxID=252184 RepID=A0AA39XJ41_9PEZI|nr:hypothetical protein B0T17DRAFT_611535 [Bombardia bombarda]
MALGVIYGLAAAMWVLSIIAIGMRIMSQRLRFGPSFWRKFQADDYLMLAAVLTIGGVGAASVLVIKYRASEPEVNNKAIVASWTPERLYQAKLANKMLIALEEFWLTTLWLLKACLLILYTRMTQGLRQSIVIKAISIYCLLGYVLIQILLLSVWCRPITGLWALPYPRDNPRCHVPLFHHRITVTVLNISSDVALLCVSLPLIAQTRLPRKRKLVLLAVFGVGVVGVLIAILNRYYYFTRSLENIFVVWYLAETLAAVVITNAPYFWVFLQLIFRLDSWSGTPANRNHNHNNNDRNRHAYVPSGGGNSAYARARMGLRAVSSSQRSESRDSCMGENSTYRTLSPSGREGDTDSAASMGGWTGDTNLELYGVESHRSDVKYASSEVTAPQVVLGGGLFPKETTAIIDNQKLSPKVRCRDV